MDPTPDVDTTSAPYRPPAHPGWEPDDATDNIYYLDGDAVATIHTLPTAIRRDRYSVYVRVCRGTHRAEEPKTSTSAYAYARDLAAAKTLALDLIARCLAAHGALLDTDDTTTTTKD